MSSDPNHALRVLIVDDHPIVRQGLGSLLSATPGLVVVGEAADGHAAQEMVRDGEPDVILMDVNLPGLSGMRVTEAIRRRWPQVRVILLTVHTQREYAVEAIRVGAHGFISKDAPPAEIIRAIRNVGGGAVHFETESVGHFLRYHAPAAPSAMVARRRTLTAREEEVLRGVADGLTNRQIAARLGVGVRTVETHRERLRGKLGLGTTAELARYALAHGLFPDRSEPK